MIDQIFFTGTYLHIKQFLTSIPKQQVFAIRAPNWIKFITSTALGKLLGFLRPVLLLNIHLIFSCTVRDKTHPLPVGTPFHIAVVYPRGSCKIPCNTVFSRYGKDFPSTRKRCSVTIQIGRASCRERG